MPIPPWAVEILQRSLSDVASRANPETIDKIRTQVRDAVEQLPAAAARGVETLMAAGDAGRESVRKWAHRYTAVSRQVINATGTLMNSDAGIPLSSTVITTGMDFLDGSRIAGPGFDNLVKQSLDELPGDGILGPLDLAITTSLDAAVASIPLLIADRSLLLHRSQAVRLPGTGSAADLIASLGFTFTEVGSIDGFSTEDFSHQDHYATVALGGGIPASSLGSGMKINILPTATRNQNEFGVPSIEQSLSDGFDIVIATPQGLLGGPASGMIFASDEIIQSLKQHRLWRLLGADLARQAMTVAALSDLHDSKSSPEPGNPTSDAPTCLMEVTEENLQARADRMATRFRGQDTVESATVDSLPAFIDEAKSYSVTSRQIRFRPTTATPAELLQTWAQSSPSLAATADGDDVVIDLRWIPASDDIAVAEAIFPKPESSED